MLEECLLTAVQCQSKRRRRLEDKQKLMNAKSVKIQKIENPTLNLNFQTSSQSQSSQISLLQQQSQQLSMYQQNQQLLNQSQILQQHNLQNQNFMNYSQFGQNNNVVSSSPTLNPITTTPFNTNLHVPFNTHSYNSNITSMFLNPNFLNNFSSQTSIQTHVPTHVSILPENRTLIGQISMAYQAYQIPEESPNNFNSVVPLKKCGEVHAEAFIQFSKKVPGYIDLSCDDQITEK